MVGYGDIVGLDTAVGIAEGEIVGDFVGAFVGDLVGLCDGALLGVFVGLGPGFERHPQQLPHSIMLQSTKSSNIGGEQNFDVSIAPVKS